MLGGIPISTCNGATTSCSSPSNTAPPAHPSPSPSHGQEPAHLVIDDAPPPLGHGHDLQQHVIANLQNQPTTLIQAQMRDLLNARNQSLTAALHQLRDNGQIERTPHG